MSPSSGSDADAVLVGSGINSLACGALLARAGWHVVVLERNDWLGGCIRTAEITEPGFHHDVLSGWHPLWVGGAAHALLGDELVTRGLEYLNTELPTATAFPDGEASFLLRSTDANAAEFDRHAPGDGAAWRGLIAGFMPNADLAFGLLGTELWSTKGMALGGKAIRRLGRHGVHEFGGNLLVSGRDWLTDTFESERIHGLLAPWVLHTGLGPDTASSGFMAQVIAVAVQEGGMPVPRGGGARLADALVRLIEDHGGTCRTGAEVDSVVVRDGAAAGVRTTEGETVGASRAVIANVTPTQLYGRLLGSPPDVVSAAGRRFRYGRAEMQIHFALSEQPRWEGDERLAGTAVVHVTPGLDGVSRAVNEAERGLLPAEPTVVCGQPLTMDPSRAPEGRGMLWIQLQELPWHVKGDAAGELDAGDGTWTEELRERYADRVQARLARHIPGLEGTVLARTTLSPADLQAANPNLVHGDPYAGSLALDQNFVWRPFPGRPGHRTPVDRLWHIGASTWPGPGLGAGSGTLVAQELLRPSARTRVLERLPHLDPEPGCCPEPVAQHLGAVGRSRVGRGAGGRIRRGQFSERGLVLPSPARAPRFSVSQISTFATSFEDDLDAYAAAGLDGIGVWELKLPEGNDDAAALEAFERSGLESASAVPLVPSILPLPRLGGPTDPAERIEALCASIHRLAPFRPSGIVCLTGTGLDLDPDAARAIVADGLRTLAAEAELAGVPIALEPYQRDDGEEWTIATTIPEAVELIEAAGGHPSLRLQFDTWHVWNTPTLLDDIRREVGRFAGVHVSDVRSETRSWADRVLPGDGLVDLPAVLAALDEAGWQGLYDLEIFSDNGTFSSAHEGSLWDVPAGELARRGRAAMLAAWESRPRLAASTTTQRQEAG